MKLNLLPKTVSEAGATRTAIILSVVVFLLLLGVGAGAMVWSNAELAKARERVAALQPEYQRVQENSRLAEAKMAENAALIRNVALAQAMLEHNTKYPDLYDDLRGYIPPYYRLQSMSATPGGPGTCQVVLVGVLQTFQQYADLAIALRRIPDVIAVSRAGFTPLDQYVPNLVIGDQTAEPVRPGEPRLPQDPIDRLNFLIAQAQQGSGFTGVGGFGTGDPEQPRGAMPDWSVVTMTLVLARDIQTPDPGATLGSQGMGAGQGTGGPAGFGGPMGGPPGGPGGPPFGGPPGGMGGPPRVGGMAGAGGIGPGDDMGQEGR